MPKPLIEIRGRALALAHNGDLVMNDQVVLAAPANKVVALTAATALTRDVHAEKTIYLNSATGRAFTLPAATGTGAKYRFINGVTVNSGSHTIKVANATDIMIGNAITLQDGGDTMVGFECASDTDTITLNGTTTGGIKGDFIEIEDVANGVFFVRATLSATGTEATPFSATVS
jgi:hypothetical protein